jgi:hypothetical protein
MLEARRIFAATPAAIVISYANGPQSISPEEFQHPTLNIQGSREAATESQLFNLELGDWTMDTQVALGD